MPLQIKLDDSLEDEFRQSIQEIYAEAIAKARADAGFKEFLTLQECCKLLDVSKSTLLRNFVERGLPTYKIESRMYIQKTELHEFIKSHQIN